MIRIGMCTIAFRERPLTEALRLASTTGFEGVEIWGKPPHMPPGTPTDDVRRVRDEVRGLGMTVAVFGSYVQPLMEDFDTQSNDCLRIAGALATPIVRVWAPPGAPGSLEPDSYAGAVKRMKEFCRRAAERGLVLAVESHDHYVVETSAGMLRFLDDVGEPNLKVNWQASFREHTDDPYDSLAALLPHTVNVHAQNFSGPDRVRRHLADGALDYRRVMGELNRAGFDGFVEIEFVNGDDPVEWLREDHAYLRGLLENLGNANCAERG